MGGSVRDWRSPGPACSFRAEDRYVVRAGLNVSAWVDMLAPADPARAVVQFNVPDQPAWVASSAAPSGRPAVQGDGVSDHLASTTAVPATLLATNPWTVYALALWGSGAVTGSMAGAGSSGGAQQSRFRTDASTLSKYQNGGSITSGSPVTTQTAWVEADFDGGTLNLADSMGGSSSVAAGNAGTDTAAVLARVQAGAPVQASDGALLWWLAYPRILSAAERSVVRNALADWGGI